MIHQHIWASPKPGMTEQEFQDYWLNYHAVNFAAKIPQILAYSVDTRIDWPGRDLPVIWSGIAEIWLRNEEEQLASLQTPEFLEGARKDEPNWAAFWNTLVLDTDQHTLLDLDGDQPGPDAVKLVTVMRRQHGVTLEAFRERLLGAHAQALKGIPGLRRLDICTTRDSWYGLGEPRFDGVIHLGFSSLDALTAATTTPYMAEVVYPSVAATMDMKHNHRMVVRQNWVIRPGERP
jgi:hypothetical protein